LETDRDVLVLVPEIGLTHQLVQHTRDRFGASVAVLHSGLAPSERWAAWRRIRARTARVVIGARSAVFAPIARLGLIVVDEEHDGAYKQEDGIRYNARDLAVVRARLATAVVVLSSPRHRRNLSRATTGAIDYSNSRRPDAAAPGRDRRPPRPVRRRRAELTDDCVRPSDGACESRAGSVFLNRRGFARSVPACGTPVACPQCSVSLTWHRWRRAGLPPLPSSPAATRRASVRCRRALPSASVPAGRDDTAPCTRRPASPASIAMPPSA
jgi:primosomal protein N' (replication factor Y)